MDACSDTEELPAVAGLPLRHSDIRDDRAPWSQARASIQFQPADRVGHFSRVAGYQLRRPWRRADGHDVEVLPTVAQSEHLVRLDRPQMSTNQVHVARKCCAPPARGDTRRTLEPHVEEECVLQKTLALDGSVGRRVGCQHAFEFGATS